MHWSDSFVEVCALGTYNTPCMDKFVCEGYAPPSAFFIFCVKILDEERHGSFLTKWAAWATLASELTIA